MLILACFSWPNTDNGTNKEKEYDDSGIVK